MCISVIFLTFSGIRSRS